MLTLGSYFPNRTNPFVKLFCRWDSDCKLLRLGRIVWHRGKVGDGKGYSAKLSLALSPRLFKVRREYESLSVTLLGVRLHYQRSFGGYMT